MASAKELNLLSGKIIGVAFQVHNEIGSGLFESVYELVFFDELRALGLSVQRQKAVKMRFKHRKFDKGFRADLIVEGLIVVEIKSKDSLSNTHFRQLLTYLRFLDLNLGLLLNFGTPSLQIRRVMNGIPESV